MGAIVVMATIIAFQYTRWHEHQISNEMGLAAAQACASMLEFADDDSGILNPDSQEYADCREAMRSLCKRNRMDYMYAYRCDLETGEVTYLFCVADDDENDARVARERSFGTVVDGPLSEQERAALAGYSSHKALELNNQFGHMLAWFCKVDGWRGNVLAGADYSVGEQRIRVFQTTSLVVGLILVMFIILLFVQLNVLRKHVFDPIHVIAERMQAFSAEKAGEFKPMHIESRDEMGEIASAFTGMAGDIDAYLHDIERMTAERVQANVEMDVARRIQLGMVPEITGLKEPGIDAYALSRTAREVGGDFYDCFIVDDGRVAVAVGDVAGKGVAASLFMIMAKTMIRDSLASGESPAAILNGVNDRLYQSNPEGMFVTVFAAVYDPITGVVRFANAGHMPPLVVGDDVRILETEPGVLLGLFEDAGLVEGTVQMAKGEALVVYTDGMTEAVNPHNEFFGEERFIAAMQKSAPYASAQSLLNEAMRAIDVFAEEREQFDDVTLLALMRTSEPMEVPAQLSAFSSIRESIMATSCDDALKLKACLACEETFVNIVSYSGASNVWFEVVEDAGSLRIVLADDGVPFDPTSVAIVEKEFEDLESGGMGIGLVRQLAKELWYRREVNRNILVAHIVPE